MTKSRLITAAVIILLALLVILQNTQPVTTRILIFSFTLSNAVLLTLTFLIGLAAGLILSMRKASHKKQ